MKNLQAADVMTSSIVSIDAHSSVVEAARRMLLSKVSGLPVVDWKNNLVGMVTEGDLLRRAEIGTERHRSRWVELLLGPGRAADDYAVAHARKVEEIMSERVIYVTSDTPLEQIVALMERHHIKRVPVVDGKSLIGIVSRTNVLAALVEATPKATSGISSDGAIRDLILSEFERQSWVPQATIDIKVKDGVVELLGSITNERERNALLILLENVQGVKSVVDRLIWVEPFSGMVIEPSEDGRVESMLKVPSEV